MIECETYHCKNQGLNTEVDCDAFECSNYECIDPSQPQCEEFQCSNYNCIHSSPNQCKEYECVKYSKSQGGNMIECETYHCKNQSLNTEVECDAFECSNYECIDPSQPKCNEFQCTEYNCIDPSDSKCKEFECFQYANSSDGNVIECEDHRCKNKSLNTEVNCNAFECSSYKCINSSQEQCKDFKCYKYAIVL